MCIDNSAQAVWLKGNVGCLAKLRVYTPATDTWTFLDTPAYYFALTTYHSQLVLAISRHNTVGFLVSFAMPLNVDGPSTLSEDGQWRETLPPIPAQLVPCSSEVGGRVSLFCFVSAVSHGDHLVVIGTSDHLSNRVFVYNGHHWASALHPPLKLHYNYMRSTVFNGHLYLMGGAILMTSVCSASLDSLVASCQPSETSQPSSVWKRLTDIYSYWTLLSCCVWKQAGCSRSWIADSHSHNISPCLLLLHPVLGTHRGCSLYIYCWCPWLCCSSPLQ